jgi:hypothetical protein
MEREGKRSDKLPIRRPAAQVQADRGRSGCGRDALCGSGSGRWPAGACEDEGRLPRRCVGHGTACARQQRHCIGIGCDCFYCTGNIEVKR